MPNSPILESRLNSGVGGGLVDGLGVTKVIFLWADGCLHCETGRAAAGSSAAIGHRISCFAMGSGAAWTARDKVHTMASGSPF